MTNMAQPRQPAGIPVGGQFVTTEREETPDSLSGTPSFDSRLMQCESVDDCLDLTSEAFINTRGQWIGGDYYWNNPYDTNSRYPLRGDQVNQWRAISESYLAHARKKHLGELSPEQQDEVIHEASERTWGEVTMRPLSQWNEDERDVYGDSINRLGWPVNDLSWGPEGIDAFDSYCEVLGQMAREGRDITDDGDPAWDNLRQDRGTRS